MEQLIEILQKQCYALHNIKVLLRMLQKALIDKDFSESSLLTEKINDYHQQIDMLERSRSQWMYEFATCNNINQEDITLHTVKKHCNHDGLLQINEIQLKMKHNIQEIHILKHSICKFSSIMGNAILKTKQILTRSSGTLYEDDGTNTEEIKSALVYDTKR